ncbi:MAG TPA: Ppx/GppA phosphatase family protein [Blastocatellia bacterium]|jgi:exopolyphosphatase/guanosine-5'-triphosphate,3'-diphosphate pyrophosphatase|nr:Ppx/GppA phosphatase family protein [Blastocatellia bacterium]
MKIAAIDIGSNSIHLVIVRAVQGQHMQIIDREKEMVRLGSGTLREHILSRETIDRAITTLQRFKKMAEANRAELIIATATSAVRESHNAEEFIEQVRKEVGLDVHLLPGVEEARLIALAVSEVTDFNDRRALIIDIGGGSTEFIITGGGGPELLLSVRVGAVRLTEKFISTDPISNDERARLVANIRADLTRVVWEVKKVGFDFVIGTSGTVLNMVNAIVQAEAASGAVGAADFEPFSETVTLDQIKRMNRRLMRLPLRDRSRVPGLEKGRADIIIGGGILLETILAELKVEEIISCDWSLREGVILDYLRNRMREARVKNGGEQSPPHSAGGEKFLFWTADDSTLDVRSRSVLSVARRYDYDVLHSHHVARLATRIFDDARDLHGLGEDERKLLQYAALLHDIGYHIAHNNHHRHGLYLIKNSEMPGFTGSEIATLSTLVRYHRGSMPKKSRDSRSRKEHEDFYSLERAERSTLLRLAAILQIADGLDRSHRQEVSDVGCQLQGASVTFTVECEGECDLEMWSAERKASWFKELFQVAVKFERVFPNPTALESNAVALT